ncbi:MAG: DegT/DnrJ/EryC1/StrS family aminotransferase, partial [Candidatus Pacearchaeota archaeon]|nr:DegT/DnrJ/EryC1/StrS family aminotransferase [Candidatus Pacearchaeota archaeon]
QHTFGEPADIDRIRGVCERHNLLLIEDAAHALGAEYKGRPVGSFGDAAFFSFSRDKVISSVYGGMVTAANPEIGERIAGIQKRTKFPSLFWTVQQLFHPLLLNLMVLPVYGIGGKYLLVLFQVFHVLSKAVHRKEKQGGRPSYFPMRLPGPLARLALLQLSKLERMRVHREQIAELYLRELKNTSFVLPRSFPERRSSRLRFPVRNKKAHEIIERAWGKNMLIGDWYTSPVAPADTNLAKMRYEPGSCPVAEALSRETLNLPTHIRCSVLNAEAVVSFLKNYED